MSNETDMQEARGEAFMRDNPRCIHCGNRHPTIPAVVGYFGAAAACEFATATPNIIIEIEGGLVARVLSDRPVNVTVVDTDIEGNGVEDATEDVYRVAPGTIPDDGQNYDLAMVSWPVAEVNPAVVAAYLTRIKKHAGE